VYVAMCWDDLWLVVICLTNLEIAGSPRKVYRDRGETMILGVEHWMGRRGQLSLFNQTPNPDI